MTWLRIYNTCKYFIFFFICLLWSIFINIKNQSVSLLVLYRINIPYVFISMLFIFYIAVHSDIVMTSELAYLTVRNIIYDRSIHTGKQIGYSSVI